MEPNTKRPTIFEIVLVLTLGSLIMALTACGAGSQAGSPQQEERRQPAEQAGSSYAGNFAGKVEGTEAFIAVVVYKENHALAYVCDGREDGPTAEVAEWFTGAVADDGSLDLTSEGGARLSAEVTGDGAEGRLAFPDGEEHAFVAESVEEPAGLYRAGETVDGTEYVGGWILLENGEERGAVRNTSTGFIDPLGDLARPSRPVSGFTGSGVDL